MNFIGWMLDVAREQSPTLEGLRAIMARTAAAGYNALGLYLEHRYAYRSAPWAADDGALTPATVAELTAAARAMGIRLVPFLNTLGHCEGFIRAEGGQHLSEGPYEGLGQQICATRPECAAFARGLIDDALAAFDDPWLHLGGDETWQLGQCPRCAARAAEVGKGGLYAEYFAPLCRYVLERGRRPALWADMLLQHPEALAALPRGTVLFDWQYTRGPRPTTERLQAQGFDVVCCPSVETYSGAWCHWRVTRELIDAHAADARATGALGVLLTSWELCYFTNYAATLPLIYAAGRRLAHQTDWRHALEQESHAGWVAAADLLGEAIPAISAFLAPGRWRQLREHLVMRQNPFSLWRAWRDEACGPTGDDVLRLAAQAAERLEADDPLMLAVKLHTVGVQWVRLVEHVYQDYRDGALAEARHALLWQGIPLLLQLEKPLREAARAGGSRADLARLHQLVEHVKLVARRIERQLGAAAFRPAFETLTHRAWTPGDQAAWRTAREG